MNRVRKNMHCGKTLNVNANGLPTEHLVANKNLLHEKFFFLESDEIPITWGIAGDNSETQVLSPMRL